MTVNYAQMKALPPPIAEKLTEYGMKADVEHFDRVNFTGSMQNNWNGRNDADEFEDRICELEDRIDELESTIEDLESTIEELESRLDDLEDR
jgi:predicted RNase H-like nuclease (RuvC/YqgF family)